MSSDTFHGWAAHNEGGPLILTELPLKTFEDDDVEIKVTHCGLCASDVHCIDCAWWPADFPAVTGHEIVGVCTRVGKNVKRIKVGDRIGVGPQSRSCDECEFCKKGEPNVCQVSLGYTLGCRFQNGDKGYGGLADKWRGPQRFAFRIPDAMRSETAATFLCAGITTYAPLRKYDVKKGSKVGVIGIGGLGHIAIMWAKAMGAEVVALSGSDRKRGDAEELGCDAYVNTSKKDELEPHMGTFTHIIATHVAKDLDWSLYFRTMKPNSFFIVVAFPDYSFDIPAMPLVAKQISVVGSTIGPLAWNEEMLEFASKHNIKPWITKYPMSQCNEAIKAFREGKPRYRFVLEN